MKEIDDCRRLIDEDLRAPARWRGPMRRDLWGHAGPGESERYASAYDRLVREAPRFFPLTIRGLREIHRLAAGDGSVRAGWLRVGRERKHVFPAPRRIPAMLEALLSRPPADPLIAAASLHLGLLTVHPFADGNGRTARLAATLRLVSAGYRSTLLAAVEQHFVLRPAAYVALLDRFRFGEIAEQECIAGLLEAMHRSASMAAWFRRRERKLRRHCAAIGITESASQDRLLSAWDRGAAVPAAACAQASVAFYPPPQQAG